MTRRSTSIGRSELFRGTIGQIASLLAFSAVSVVSACSTADDATLDPVGVAQQGLIGVDCDLTVTAALQSSSTSNFSARVTVTNNSGATATNFRILVRAGAAQLFQMDEGSFQAVEGGYVLSPGAAQLKSGKSYSFVLTFHGTYSGIVANALSNAGVSCDTTPPNVALTTSAKFFSTTGSLSLSATTTDNVEVAKVVFVQDGVVVGEDRTAPFTLDVAVTSALNGGHNYVATAYDLSGNVSSSAPKRVRVSVDAKFFGNILAYSGDTTNFLNYFDQVTPGNAGKWGTVEATRDFMNFGELDQAYAFAKSNGLPFKLHTLIWGQQQPNWIANLPAAEQLAEIEEWMAALAARYPEVDLIDVVNEPLHAKPSYRAALGGEGTTGWDWVIKSFELARRYFPNADLHLNDYSVLTRPDFVTPYLTIVNLLNERGLIDGIGEQAHFYERAPDPAVMQANLDTLAATGLPLYISEFDVNFADDARQALRVSELFPRFWSHPSVLGVTYWGYRKGAMWQTDAWLTSADGTVPRAALTWMQCYIAGNQNCPLPEYVPQPRVGDINQITLEAEDYDTANNLIPVGSAVGYAGDGSWLRFDRVRLNDNWNTISATYAKPGTAAVSLSVHLDSLDSPAIATLALGDTGSWGTFKTASVPWLPIVGERTVFVRFNGGGANVDKIQIGAPQETSTNIIADNDFESGTIDGWWTWAGPKDATTNVIANTTARAVTGTHSLVMTGRSGNSPLVNTFTSLAVPGKTYKVSVWATVGGAASTAQITTATQCVGGSTIYGRLGGWGNTKSLTDGVWTEFAGDIAVPNCSLANVAIWLEGPGAGVDLYIDHISVRQVISANLISDGTFESGQGAWGGWGFASLAVVNTSAHSGLQSLKATTMSQYGAIARDILAFVAPGKRYTASAWVSVGSLASGQVKWQTVQRCNGATGDSYPWLAGTTATNGQWVQITGTVDLTGCTTVEKLMLFAGADAGDLYLDDVSLTAL